MLGTRKISIMQPLVFITIILAVALGVSGRRISNRIVGGKPAPDGKYPYQVSVQNRYNHWCGGAIISKRWILTAAHCFMFSAKPAQYTILAGTNKLSETGDAYQAEQILLHPDFWTHEYNRDVALIRVTEDIAYNEKVQPIRLPESDFTTAGDLVVLTGWGSIGGWSQPNRLQHINVKIISQEACKKFFGEKITDQICTFTKFDEGACHGDSGGPLVADGVVVGVVAWSRGCGEGYPGVYPRVWNFIKWISESIENNI